MLIACGSARIGGIADALREMCERLASYWLPIPADGVAYPLFRRRYS
jgi:hypothetical protein